MLTPCKQDPHSTRPSLLRRVCPSVHPSILLPALPPSLPPLHPASRSDRLADRDRPAAGRQTTHSLDCQVDLLGNSHQERSKERPLIKAEVKGERRGSLGLRVTCPQSLSSPFKGAFGLDKFCCAVADSSYAEDGDDDHLFPLPLSRRGRGEVWDVRKQCCLLWLTLCRKLNPQFS